MNVAVARAGREQTPASVGSRAGLALGRGGEAVPASAPWSAQCDEQHGARQRLRNPAPGLYHIVISRCSLGQPDVLCWLPLPRTISGTIRRQIASAANGANSPATRWEIPGVRVRRYFRQDRHDLFEATEHCGGAGWYHDGSPPTTVLRQLSLLCQPHMLRAARGI